MDKAIKMLTDIKNASSVFGIRPDEIDEALAELKAKDEQIVELNAEIEKANQIIQAKHKWVMDEKEQTEFYFDKYQEIKAKIKTKDERIEAQSSVIIACQNAILQKDEHITNRPPGRYRCPIGFL